MSKQKKVKTGFSVSQEAHDALREMADGPRGYGDFVSALILAERDKRRAENMAKRLAQLEQDFEALERHLKERGVLLYS